MYGFGIGISPSNRLFSSGGGSLDPDASAFITTASITDGTQQSAINQLVLDLKSYSIWSKMYAIYPMVGGNSTSHSYNLKNISQFQLSFVGGWTHSLTGALPNGTNAYANTLLNASTLSLPYIGYYSRSNTNNGLAQIDMGCGPGVSSSYLWVSAWYNNGGYSNILGRNSSQSILLNGGASTDSRGLFWVNKIGSTAKIGKNYSILNSATDSVNTPNINIYVGAMNNNSIAQSFTNRECSFSIIANGLTDIDTSNLYTSVQAFQTTSSRNV